MNKLEREKQCKEVDDVTKKMCQTYLITGVDPEYGSIRTGCRLGTGHPGRHDNLFGIRWEAEAGTWDTRSS
jgi:hypothetical protein